MTSLNPQPRLRAVDRRSMNPYAVRAKWLSETTHAMRPAESTNLTANYSSTFLRTYRVPCFDR